jgi:hypothetical protein
VQQEITYNGETYTNIFKLLKLTGLTEKELNEIISYFSSDCNITDKDIEEYKRYVSDSEKEASSSHNKAVHNKLKKNTKVNLNALECHLHKSDDALALELEKIIGSNKNNKIEVLGVEYDSALQMCMYNKISVEFFCERLLCNETVEDILLKHRAGRAVMYKGKLYSSIGVLCKEKNVSENLVRSRLYNGMSVEDAVDKEVKGYIKIEYDGVTYNSKAELCRKFDCDYPKFIKLTAKGASIAEAIKLANTKESSTKQYTRFNLVYNGKKYNTVKELCNEYGIERHYLIKRLKLGMTLDQIIGSKDKRKKSVTYNGKEYDALADLLDEYEISRATYNYRINRGASLSEALQAGKNSARSVTYNNTVYASLRELCEVYNIKYVNLRSALTYKRKLGMSTEEAIDDYMNMVLRNKEKSKAHN